MTVLRSREEFERNPRAYDDALVWDGDCLGVIHAFLGAYCAGLRDRAQGESVRDALLAEPNPSCHANQTIKWLLGSIRVPDVMGLSYEGGIPLGRIADHVRFNEITRPDLICFLNRFAIRVPAGSGRVGVVVDRTAP